MILVAGQKITADEALIWGLVDRLETNPLEAAHSLIPEAKADHMAAIKSMI